MIIHRTDRWARSLLHYHGTALARMKGRLLFVTAVAAAITAYDLQVERFHDDLTPLPFQLIGVALGIFLGFRNNTSYDRFWEGRKLWGNLVNVTRSLTRQTMTLVGARALQDMETACEVDAAELAAFQREQVHRLIAYVHALRLHLRNEDDLERLRGLVPEAEREALRGEINRPVAILHRLAERFRDAWARGWVHSMHFNVLEQSLTDLTNIQGGCERIKNTPIPFNYRVLVHRIVAIYCFALPFGLVAMVQEYTPIVVMIIAYAFFGLDAVGDEIDDPFGTDPNDLPLTQLSTSIEIVLRQRLGERELPSLPPPVRGQVT